jgi:DNA-binding CsgD family transcriptional regulator
VNTPLEHTSIKVGTLIELRDAESAAWIPLTIVSVVFDNVECRTTTNQPIFTKTSDLVRDARLPPSPDELDKERSLIKPFDVLTRRQQQVATALVNGQSNSEIAKELGCSIKTVDTHRAHVMRKLKVRNNVMLARLAIETGYAKITINKLEVES